VGATVEGDEHGRGRELGRGPELGRGRELVEIREARPDELAAAGDVVVEAYLALPGDPHRPYLARVRDAAGRARHCPVLVAVGAEGRVVGSVTYVPGPGNPFAERERDGEAGFRMLGVAPDAQGRGIGRRLVVACVERARADGRTGLVILTTPVMTSAQALYRSLGFVRLPELDDEPVPGVRLLAFRLELDRRADGG
jgi:ribosomal protein S18 acetylase RimI-like enzyme